MKVSEFIKLKKGNYIKANITYAGSITKGKRYKVVQVEPDHGMVWVTCDDGTNRRGGYDIFDIVIKTVNKLTKTI